MILQSSTRALLAAALMAGIASSSTQLASFAAPPPNYGYVRKYSRSRPTGNPSGSKLARKASRGQIGIRKGW